MVLQSFFALKSYKNGHDNQFLLFHTAIRLDSRPSIYSDYGLGQKDAKINGYKCIVICLTVRTKVFFRIPRALD